MELFALGFAGAFLTGLVLGIYLCTLGDPKADTTRPREIVHNFDPFDWRWPR